MSMTPEEQIEVIKARAEGKTIECTSCDHWEESTSDFNFCRFVYRVAKKLDVVINRNVTVNSDRTLWLEYRGYPNLKLTFDGETGKLKSAEVL